MCGRYVTPDETAMQRFWRIGPQNNNPYKARYNVAPTTLVPMVVQQSDGSAEVMEARWGLIPPWWKQEVPPALTFNARSEEVAQKPTWRESLRQRRCLMPALGWYEWNENEQVVGSRGRKVNQPYFLHSPEVELITIAGLWASWQRPQATPIVSCALLTKAAAPAIAHIHHRMPVIMKPQYHEAWLNPATPAADVAAMIADACEQLTGYAVSTRVNNARNEAPDLLQAINK